MNIRVKYRVSCIFLIASILAAGMLPGCKTQRARQTRHNVQENKQPIPLPLKPISKDILQLAKESGVGIEKFQFYISTTIELTQDRKSRFMEVDEDGAVIVRNTAISRKITINKETKGSYITAIPNLDNPAVLEICFDNENKKSTLFFTASPDGTHFDLKLYYEDPKMIKYGGGMFNLTVPSTPNPIPPQLLIKFDERTLNRPDIRVISGSSVTNK